MNHSQNPTRNPIPKPAATLRDNGGGLRYQRLSEARGAVVRWLRAHPLSTAEEIFKATGVSILSVLRQGMFKCKKYNGKRCWRVVAHPEEFVR